MYFYYCFKKRLPLRQREFPGLAVSRQMGFPCSTLLQLLNFIELFVGVRKLAEMQWITVNLQYYTAEMWCQIALKHFLCSLLFPDLQSKTNLVGLFFLKKNKINKIKKPFTAYRFWGCMVLKRCKV